MTMQQVKINAYQAVKWVRHASSTHYSNHPQLLVEGWHLGEDKVPAPPSRAGDVATRAGNLQLPAMQGTLASASNDVVMQDAEVAPDRFMAKLSRRLRGA
jgi:hypothetical protein